VKLSGRLKKLEAVTPKCDGWYSRIVRPDEELTEADRCRVCGEYHVIVVQEVIVTSPEDVQRVWALNSAGGDREAHTSGEEAGGCGAPVRSAGAVPGR
jgi:hypothetical protein